MSANPNLLQHLSHPTLRGSRIDALANLATQSKGCVPWQDPFPVVIQILESNSRTQNGSSL